jgi:formylglycine-generating enzyme
MHPPSAASIVGAFLALAISGCTGVDYNLDKMDSGRPAPTSDGGDAGLSVETGGGSGGDGSGVHGLGGDRAGGDGSMADGSVANGAVADGSVADGSGEVVTLTACAPGGTKCVGNAVQTCGANGLWGNAVQCPSGVPNCAGGLCAPPPSCEVNAPGTGNCGAGSESCCTSPEVTGGTYYRAYVNTGTGATALANPASVTGFRLDKYFVTVGRFRSFVNAWSAGYTPAAGSGKHAHLNGGRGLTNSTNAGTYEPGWLDSDSPAIAPAHANLTADPANATWTDSAGANENLPVTTADWYDAYAFCVWDGGFLPSEAEWEYAAAGGSEQREYPWGNIEPGAMSRYAIYGCYYPKGTPGSCGGIVNIAPVGTATMGLGLSGQLDLAGELYEWTLDSFADYADPCIDCVSVTTAGSNRVRRGGAFGYAAPIMRPPVRNDSPPSIRDGNIGFRCARAP